MSEPVLSLHNVAATYGAGPVLRGIDLELRPGEVVGLVGPNGSGKTTLVRVASRALRPSEGIVRASGRDLYALSAREAARLIAIVPQDLVPAFSFAVLDMVLMGRSPYRSRWGGGTPDDWARVRAAMAATQVQHLADRTVDELSGGERRRVILAQALAQEAPVLMLDEPTTHLDVRHILDVLAIVRRLAERDRRAVLAIHHDLNLASSTSDRLVALHRGEVVASGSPAAVVTPVLLREVYGVEADVSTDATTGRPSVRIAITNEPAELLGRRAHVVGGAGRAAPVLRTLVEAGFDVSVGVLHGSDTDEKVAERLNLVRVSVPPFSDIDTEAESACRDLMHGSDLLVVADAPFGPGNMANLLLALEAARAGVRTIVLEQIPVEERDFTGGEAARCWADLREIAEVIGSYEELKVVIGAEIG